MTSPADALAAVRSGDWGRAAHAARTAAGDHPTSRLAPALARFLAGSGSSGVYDEPSAFDAFISNAGNVPLYQRTTARLAELHAEVQPARVLDLGCGDGRVTAAVLAPATARVDLVEPSAELLRTATAAVERPGRTVVGHGAGATEALAALDAEVGWDLVQSTFALHATHPDERPALLAELARRTRRLVVVDFDVPAFADGSTEHLRYLADRYERGIAEYAEAHPEVVTGFLLPVLVGQLDPDRPRHTFEQPAAAWAAQLEAAGFATTVEPISPYWWADAVLVSGTLG